MFFSLFYLTLFVLFCLPRIIKLLLVLKKICKHKKVKLNPLNVSWIYEKQYVKLPRLLHHQIWLFDCIETSVILILYSISWYRSSFYVLKYSILAILIKAQRLMQLASAENIALIYLYSGLQQFCPNEKKKQNNKE